MNVEINGQHVKFLLDGEVLLETIAQFSPLRKIKITTRTHTNYGTYNEGGTEIIWDNGSSWQLKKVFLNVFLNKYKFLIKEKKKQENYFQCKNFFSFSYYKKIDFISR